MTPFEQFWRAYPKKVAKRDAQKAWRKIPLADLHADEIVAGVEMWKLSRQWQDKQYIPYPATWLRRRQWEDEVEPDLNKGQLRDRSNLDVTRRFLPDGHPGKIERAGRELPGGTQRVADSGLFGGTFRHPQPAAPPRRIHEGDEGV